jgi:hypothetical protein
VFLRPSVYIFIGERHQTDVAEKNETRFISSIVLSPLSCTVLAIIKRNVMNEFFELFIFNSEPCPLKHNRVQEKRKVFTGFKMRFKIRFVLSIYE